VLTVAIRAVYKTYINIRRYGNRSARPASIADGVPSASETGEPELLFSLQTGYQMSRGKTKKFRGEKVYANADLARCKACVKLLLGITLP